MQVAAEEARVSGDLEKKKRYREQLERMATKTMNANLALSAGGVWVWAHQLPGFCLVY